MKTAEEIFAKYELKDQNGEGTDCLWYDDALLAMEEYAEQQVRNHAPDVMPRLFVITAQEGWNEMFWDKEKAQHKIDTQYKKDFPNDEFWIEEVNVS